MTTDEKFIETIMCDYALNKAQLAILGQPYPPISGWESLVVNQNISEENINLLLLLKGKFSLKLQDQIVKNYRLMLEFNHKKLEQSIDIKIDSFNGMDELQIYCDGACINNPGNAGSGLTIYNGNEKPILLYGFYEEYGTNNTAELNALYKALTIAATTKNSGEITIFSDSQYSIDCISKWAYSWKSKSWTKKGGEIKNLEIIKLAHAIYDSIKDRIILKHVKGHAGIEGNELADRMAMLAITSKNIDYKEYVYGNIEEILKLRRG
ncbi:MAG: ribonuclease H family protein [Sulfuricurvum sp.]|nr:ribonuclease H family protein [Sulfuricurvum sp.]